MPKIIKNGEYPEQNKIECEDCGCIFLYYNSEVEVSISSPDEQDLLGGFGVHKYIKCPECNHVCTISCDFIEDESFIESFINGLKKLFNRKKKEEI